jgi:hypothetical protein
MRNLETTRYGSPFQTKLTNGRNYKPNFKRKTYKYLLNKPEISFNLLWKSITLSSEGMEQHLTQEFSCSYNPFKNVKLIGSKTFLKNARRLNFRAKGSKTNYSIILEKKT